MFSHLSLLTDREQGRRNSIPWVVGLATLGFLLVWLSPPMPVGVGLKSYAPLHAILEIFAVVISGAIFAVGWHGRITLRTDHLAIVASGFLGVALLDVAHLLSFSGMPDWVTPAGGGKAIYFWFAARYLAIFSILALVLSNRKRVLPKRVEWFALFGSIFVVAISCWIVLWHTNLLPVFFIPGEGLTTIKIIIEWILVALVLITLVMVIKQKNNDSIFDANSLIAALWLMAMSELCFTLYSNTADIFNLMGHIFKVISYGYLYRAIVVGSIKLPYKMLSESQQTLQQLTDNIRQVFWMASGDQKTILYVSPAYETIWQRSCRGLMESPDSFVDSVHPDDRARITKLLPDYNKESGGVEYRIIRPDDSIRWIRSRAFPIRNANNEVWRIAGVAEDITKEKESATKLSNKENLLQYTQAIAKLGSWELDIERDHLVWSDEVYRIFGYGLQEFPATYEAFLQAVHPDDRELVDRSYRNSLEQGKDGYELEHRVVRHDTGEIRYVHEKCHHVRDTSGKVTRSLGMVHDITERKLAEVEREKLITQLTQSQKMEAIGQLTGGIAHDFNNMLAAILGNAQLLNSTVNSSQDARPAKYINEILVAGGRAKELISQMLLFSRLRQDGDSEEPPVILVQTVVKEVAHLIRSSIPTTIKVTFNIEDESARVAIQPVQLHQILLNLVINARDAISEYGSIHLNVSTHYVDTSCDACHEHFLGNCVELKITDTGSGIKKTILSNIFNPFFTTKETGKGTGMGLSVVYGIVHSHNGHIQISSEEHKGTAISIFLPAKSEKPTAMLNDSSEERAEKREKLAGLHILLVDDEKAITTMMTEFLELHGASVEAFTNSADAVTRFKQDPQAFNLVITDEAMPELSGLDMTKMLLGLRPEMPIILCTGYSEKANAEMAQELGIAAFMYKPLELDQLLQVVQSVSRK